tara:strand:- start:510 stop:728 length:219 start_codon:yes stop_codon:yes gene_type:complete
MWVTATILKPTNELFLSTNLIDNPVNPQAISASLLQTANKLQLYGLIQAIRNEALHTSHFAGGAFVCPYALL